MTFSRRRSKLRVANVSYLVGLPYAHLRELTFADYEENTAAENARKLHEGEVDVALMPIIEFALHGGYVGLDFGVVCQQRSDSMILYANSPVKELRTISLYEGAGSSVVLLRLLLDEKWMTVPRLVRERDSSRSRTLQPFEGRLEIHENMGVFHQHYRVATDLVAEWYHLTKLPFVPLVWATRPGTLTLEQYRAFHQRFHVGLKMREAVAQMKAPQIGVPAERLQQYLEHTLAYQFDETALAGFEEFIRRAAVHRILPDTPYRSATFTLLDRKAKPAVGNRSVDRILQDAVEGKRIGISDGARLAKMAKLSDLGLVADMLRSKLTVDRSISHLITIGANIDRPEALRAQLDEAVREGVSRVLLVVPDIEARGLGVYEGLLNYMKGDFGLSVEGFSVRDMLLLARQSNLLPQEVIRRLVTAGLDAVPAFGGGMLIDRFMRKESEGLKAADWLHAMKWVHYFGAKSSCCMTVGPHETWEERILHLQKLRFFHGENPGFSYFFCEHSQAWKRPPPVELRLRALSIARIFLDNVPCVQSVSFQSHPTQGALSLCFGASEVRVMGATLDDGVARESFRLLRDLYNIGMDIDESAVQRAALLPPSEDSP